MGLIYINMCTLLKVKLVLFVQPDVGCPLSFFAAGGIRRTTVQEIQPCGCPALPVSHALSPVCAPRHAPQRLPETSCVWDRNIIRL